MKVVVIKSFHFAFSNRKMRRLQVGEIVDIHERFVYGLIEAGLVEDVNKPRIEKDNYENKIDKHYNNKHKNKHR